MKPAILTTDLQHFIYHLRGKAVMLDKDLASLYHVGTKRLNEAVKRNIKRFPPDFMFQITGIEAKNLRSQFATSNYGGRRYLAYAFTEQGVAMLSGVLKSDVAIDMNINIMRAFVQLRRMGLSVVDIRRKIGNMESKYDHQFKVVFDALRKILNPEPKNKRSIGFIQHRKV